MAGTRISVEGVLGYLASGMTIDQIIHDFPELNAELIDAVIEFESLRERSRSCSWSFGARECEGRP